MKVFYLLKNGEIKEGDAPNSIMTDWDDILEEIEGIKVLAVATTKEAIDKVRKAISPDEESLIGTRKEVCPA
jgi:hypothetical protein